MGWYKLWTEECIGPTEIAKRNVRKVGRSTVCEAVHKVAEWLRMQNIDHIMTIRDRQTAIHEKVVAESINAWQKSIGNVVTVTVVSGDEEKITTKTEVSQGETAYLSTLISAAKAIREIWGADAPKKSEVELRHSEEIEGLPGGQGFPNRAAAMKAAAAALISTAEAMEIPKNS